MSYDERMDINENNYACVLGGRARGYDDRMSMTNNNYACVPAGRAREPEGQRGVHAGRAAHLERGEERMQEESARRRRAHTGGERIQEESARRRGAHAGEEHMQERSARGERECTPGKRKGPPPQGDGPYSLWY